VPPMQKRVLEAIESIPGVTAVGMADVVPLSGGGNTSIYFSSQTADLRPSNAAAEGYVYNISPGYLEASQTPLLTGRTFTWQDDMSAVRVAIVNQTFARKVFGSEAAAVGRTFKLREGTVVEVVGVVEDGKYFSIAEEPQSAVFLPLLQSPANETVTVARFTGDPRAISAAIRDKLRELDSGLPYDMRTWEQTMEGALFPPRIATVSLGVLGVMGALLSLTGIFGVAAYSVSKRKKDLGIRMALGAKRRDVLEAALARPLKLLAAGSVAGLILGILASRVLAVIVYQATPRDPVVLAGVVLAMSLLGLVATWIPAQRALSIDPLTLLREE
jgi:predicted permease